MVAGLNEADFSQAVLNPGSIPEPSLWWDSCENHCFGLIGNR